MKLIKSIIVIILLAASYPLSATDNKPYGLLTDLVEHTDYTWHNGYVSNVPVWKTEDAIEHLQYVKIGSAYPSFSWIVPGDINGTVQTGYRIIVADTPEQAALGEGTIWDSGMIAGNTSTSILYGGTPLQPERNYFWRVKTVTNTGGESDWSDIKAFRTAGTMKNYDIAFYPQVKEMEHPVQIHKPDRNTTWVDFGKAAFGQLVVNLTSETGKDTVVIHLGECIAEGRINRKPGGTIRYHRYPVALMKGTHTYRIKIRKDRLNTRPVAVHIPDYIGEVLPFRYCEIEGYEKTVSTSGILREAVSYPFDESASFFQCSNDTLNQIWELCKYSIKATSALGIYIDGDRERIPYEADALINQLCHYGVDREYSMARRSYEYLLDYPTWPTEWILQAVLIAWNDYLYTGDSRSLKANYGILQTRTLMELREKNGLISTTTGLITPDLLAALRFDGQIRDIVDWPHTGILGLNKQEGGEADGFVFTDYNAVTNAYHYETLKLMARIAQVLDLPEDAARFSKEVAGFLPRFNKTFLNKQGYYVDGDTTTHASLHANMFPVAFDMVPAGSRSKVLDFIRSRQMACSVYGAQFLMDALYEANDADYALHMLTKTDDRSWYNMIRAGSTITLEAWDNKYKPNQDWNHAWGAVPANIIPRKLMGVEPVVPGFSKVRIKPQVASLEWAKATIPTIKGEIKMEIENRRGEYLLQVTIPANMEAEIYLPFITSTYRVTNNGTSQKATQVKGQPFLSLGTFASGSYTIAMTY